jgi:hypothetical protein
MPLPPLFKLLFPQDIMNNDIKNKKNGSALMMTLLILTGSLTVVLIAADLVVNGIKSGRNQSYSTKAYFAAEAGTEYSLWEMRKNYFYQDEDEKNIFSGELANGSIYHVDYASSSPAIIFISTGVFNGVYRAVKTSFFYQIE